MLEEYQDIELFFIKNCKRDLTTDAQVDEVEAFAPKPVLSDANIRR